MPNKTHRDKQKFRPKSKPRHVAELMQRIVPMGLTRSGDCATTPSHKAPQAPANVSSEWREILKKALDPELAPHITNVLAKPRELVVFTESAAWCTRLKLALEQIGAVVRARDPAITKIKVRIMPAGAAR